MPSPSTSRASAIEHRRRPLLRIALLGLVLWALGAANGGEEAQAFGVQLQTGLASYPPFGAPGEEVLARTRNSGARFLKLALAWRTIAPANPPPGFDAANPYDPSYRWKHLDWTISHAIARGLTPVIDILEPPTWAESPPGSSQARPNLTAFTMFTQALVTRYDGAQPGLPRVAYWEAWNEPNGSFFLEPQIEGTKIVSVEFYRDMLNDFASVVHGVRPDNIVIGGALFPNEVRRPGITAIAPLDFTRQLFCLSAGAKPSLVCNARVNVDAWSIHPYTSGGPSTLPANRKNIWIANLNSITAAVRAAQRLGTLVSSHPAQVWVSEFGWNSSPPTHSGVPLGLEQRWVAETLYLSWRAEISVFTWFQLADDAVGVSPFQSGIYFFCPGGVSCETPKPAASAFRFPFVAYTKPRGRVLVWGRTPAGTPGRVRIQWLQGSRWRTFALLSSDRDGIFTASPSLPRAANPASTQLRASQVGGASAPAFSLQRPPAIAVTPFGA
ncbi:MAG TPA: hypothetical protein VNU28_02465 [Solirubrobacteraceae bacterium]|jgi:hypothetical protein|nr:hypothetical protein [Solirubrobacteraceae bacterium]